MAVVSAGVAVRHCVESVIAVADGVGVTVALEVE